MVVVTSANHRRKERAGLGTAVPQELSTTCSARERPLPLAASLRQGDAVGRPSRLGLRVDAERGIYVTGAVLELGRGTIDV